jgi:hypothetical protein
MLNDFKKVFDHHPVSEADLLNRINRALTGKGLRVQPATQETASDGDSAGYEFVHGAKRFRLRTAIEELARALGILGQPSQAEVHVHARNRACVCELRPTAVSRREH